MPTPGQDPTNTSEASTPIAPNGMPAAAPHQFDFPPVRNGVDYLVSVVDHLTVDDVGPREIKYAVLHLQAAAEVLLKARLVREHWSLVFDDPGQATERAFRSADFKSCAINEAVTRLCNIVGITITDKEQEALRDLGRDRNALQHYGLTHNARALEARAGRVLDFLVRFLDEILLPDLDRDEKNTVGTDMIHIRNGLEHIHTYITQRMRRLRGEMRGQEERTIVCPTCGQLALVADRTQNGCRFCGTSWITAPWLIQMWLDEPTHDCPRCHQELVVIDVVVASESDPVSFCFGCPGVVPLPDVHVSADSRKEDRAS
ncbi:hypothetical protein [Streptomyces sp. NBC_00078]|uniref:hypothetical protein n=1 Tax=unclassified Streptomyces TaxID=2593676 RepID=UPI00224F7001|nr:hypothetical protein [Streptomyces sp. NBC_00078]MCX5426170.1 hypothetical protein [Streptomyces sp. NBC_00078]